jgi:hypothetical protein
MVGFFARLTPRRDSGVDDREIGTRHSWCTQLPGRRHAGIHRAELSTRRLIDVYARQHG